MTSETLGYMSRAVPLANPVRDATFPSLHFVPRFKIDDITWSQPTFRDQIHVLCESNKRKTNCSSIKPKRQMTKMNKLQYLAFDATWLFLLRAKQHKLICASGMKILYRSFIGPVKKEIKLQMVMLQLVLYRLDHFSFPSFN